MKVEIGDWVRAYISAFNVDYEQNVEVIDLRSATPGVRVRFRADSGDHFKWWIHADHTRSKANCANNGKILCKNAGRFEAT